MVWFQKLPEISLDRVTTRWKPKCGLVELCRDIGQEPGVCVLQWRDEASCDASGALSPDRLLALDR